MKKFNLDLNLFIFLLASFFLIALSSCNIKGEVILNGKQLLLDKMKAIQGPIGISLKSDTNKLEEVKVDTIINVELTGDFRYDNMLK